MSKQIYFMSAASSNHDALKDLEYYLDNSPELIPHSTHSDLVGIFDRLNGAIGGLIKDYEDRIEELENQIKELEQNNA